MDEDIAAFAIVMTHGVPEYQFEPEKTNISEWPGHRVSYWNNCLSKSMVHICLCH